MSIRRSHLFAITGAEALRNMFKHPNFLLLVLVMIFVAACFLTSAAARSIAVNPYFQKGMEKYRISQNETDQTIAISSYQQSIHDYLIKNYSHFHQEHRYQGKKLIVRFDKTHPGIGDRIGTMLNAYLLASFSRRILLIYWEHPLDLQTFLIPKMRDLEFRPGLDASKKQFICERECSSKFDLQPFFREEENVIIFSLPKPSLNVLRILLSQQEKNSTSTNAVQNLPLFHTIYKHIFESLFRFPLKIQNYLNSNQLSFQNPYLAVHARAGYGVGEYGGTRFLSGKRAELLALANCFLTAVERTLRSEKHNNIRAVYVTSDTTPLQKRIVFLIQKKFKNVSILFQRENVSEHPIHLQQCNSKNLFYCQHIMLDFILISRAATIVASPSSFSSSASYIGATTISEYIDSKKCIEVT